MNDITIRFLAIYNYLKNEKLIFSPKAFANEIGVSNSLITEICKERTNAGIVPIQNLLLRYDIINAEWLLTGRGIMLKEDITPIVSEIDTTYKDLADARLEIIEGLKFKITTLEQELSKLKYSQESFLHKSVAEPTPELAKKQHK